MMEDVILEIPYKLPSLNEYTKACRTNKYVGAKMKRDIQNDIGWFINQLPKFEYPVSIHFHWVESNKRRDLDNVAFGKKFILDSLVECGKLKDDNRRYVVAFQDTFEYAKETKVVITISAAEVLV